MTDAARVEGHGAKITDEGIAKIRARIGQGFPGRRPWRTEASADAIYHLAYAIGDLNPLYIDPEYAAKSRWGRLVAPPIMVQAMDTLRAVGHSGLPEGLPGVHSIWAGCHYEWERPLLEGDRVRHECYLKDVVEREGDFGGGRSLAQTYEAKYWNQRDEYLGLRQVTYMRFERQKAAERKKYGTIELAHWTKPEIDRLMDEYRSYRRTTKRYWEDVTVGQKLDRVIKGPLTPTAEIAFESFFGVYLVGNIVAARLYEKHPALMIPNEQGVPEPPQRVHWDNQFTQRLLGLPGAYDLGPVRCSWMIQALTDWIGDDGRITRITTQYRRFNYMGDVTWAEGEVTDKFERDGKAYIRCNLWTRNHRDEITAKGVAEAEMARRDA
ncbi:MAG TPA: MaoC family dehydratase N-terminal domain-containing protein [Candidatus Limnocylindria bacterium]|nr:MaoC family dehydratase N-terminal domain-containing protein [Candidatus Limnocylindria bacterium]